MRVKAHRPRRAAKAMLLCASTIIAGASLIAPASAQAPQVRDPDLGVRTAASGFVTPVGMAFLGPRDWLVIEKNTGQVKRVVNGEVTSTVLDLAVNAASERGLLSIALHPQFDQNGFVYLFWSCAVPPPPAGDPYVPTAVKCPREPARGADTVNVLATPLLGNRVDRFRWDGTRLHFDRHIILLRSFQHDAAPIPPDQGDEEQPALGNHDGGVTRFGPDGKLYIQFGDVGRRGALQNLPSGPTLTGRGPIVPDDQFGGPMANNAHYSGVIIRLNDDGTAPTDNPFYDLGEARGGEIGANLKKTFAYGVRNGFGMAFDPLSGNLWDQENGEDAFDELNLIRRGMNSGWIQIQGPMSRLGQYREIETTSLNNETFPNLQQYRWGPERIARETDAARARMYKLPGSHYSDPEFSWKYVLAPGAIGFHKGNALGARYNGDLFVGFAQTQTLGGPLFRFNLTGDRRNITSGDPRLADRVMDNRTFYDMVEGDSLLFGTNFGIVTDIQTGPDGNLFLVSLANGDIYEIFRRPR